MKVANVQAISEWNDASKGSPVRSFFKRMTFTFENAADVVFCLHDRVIEEAVGTRYVLLHAFRCGVIENGKQCIHYEDDCNHIVNRYNTAEGEHAERIGSVYDQARKQQDDDGCGLQPVPEAPIRLIHVNSFGSFLSPSLFPRRDVSQCPMASYTEKGADKHQ